MGRPKKRKTSDGKELKYDQTRGPLEHGRDSKYVQYMMERLGQTDLLTEVEKMQLRSMASEMLAKSLAFDIDSYNRKILINRIKEMDMNLLDYEADLIATQGKLSEMEGNLHFHKKVLADLKQRYIDEPDPTLQKQILEQIDAREDQIAKYEKLMQQALEIRNKIRKEIDKKEYNQAQIKLKEEEIGKKTINITDISLD